jgi:hypothetical protein
VFKTAWEDLMFKLDGDQLPLGEVGFFKARHRRLRGEIGKKINGGESLRYFHRRCCRRRNKVKTGRWGGFSTTSTFKLTHGAERR